MTPENEMDLMAAAMDVAAKSDIPPDKLDDLISKSLSTMRMSEAILEFTHQEFKDAPAIEVSLACFIIAIKGMIFCGLTKANIIEAIETVPGGPA